MDITEEMYSAYRAGRHEHRIRDAHHDGPNALGGECCDRAGLERVAPLIAAQALRQAAEFVRDDESDGAFTHGDRCSYGPPGECDCERGITYRWLMSRSRGLCGAPNWHKAGYACGRAAGHVPDYDHRYGPVTP